MAQLASSTVYGDLKVTSNARVDGAMDITNGLTLTSDTNWLTVVSASNTQGSQGAIKFLGNLANTPKQGTQIRFNDFDATRAPYGLHIERTSDNTEVAGNKPYLDVQGKIYADGGYEVAHANTGTLYLSNKMAIKGATDTWLRINDDNAFTSGVYFGTATVRTDGNLQVGNAGATLLVTTAAFTYKSNTIYHAGNKPTASDVAALPIAGGTMTGPITAHGSTGIEMSVGSKVTKTGSSWITHGGDGASATDANIRIHSWQGIGFANTCSGQPVTQGDNAFWINVRTGNTYTQGSFYANSTKKVATEEYVNTKVSGDIPFSTSITFTKSVDLKKTITHNFGIATYKVVCTSNSGERHVFWSNKLANTVEINLDDEPFAADIIVDVMIMK